MLGIAHPEPHPGIVTEIVGCAKLCVNVEVLNQSLKKRIAGYSLGVADQTHKSSGSGNGNVHASLLCKKADDLFGIAPDHGNDNALLLPALEAVDCRNLNSFSRQQLLDKVDLCVIRGDYTYLGWQQSVLLQLKIDYLYNVGLSHIKLALR